MTDLELVPYLATSTAAVVAVVSIARLLLKTNRYLPLIAAVVGIVVTVAYAYVYLEEVLLRHIISAAVVGLETGLAAAGAWKLGKLSVLGIGVRSINGDSKTKKK